MRGEIRNYAFRCFFYSHLTAKIPLKPKAKSFFIYIRAESHNHTYGFELQLFGEVLVDESKWNTKGRNIIMNIIKTDQEAEYWPRLTKEKVKNTHIQADWAKWVDEDEEDQAKPLGEDWNEDNMNNFNMGGQGGNPMMGGGDSDDEDEEEEEEEHAGHSHGDHMHSEHCSHEAEAGHSHEPKKNADLGDLDAEEETA